MKIFVMLLIFFLSLGCAQHKGVYWCGDHPCINKKEKEAYFKKTMIVEVKHIEKDSYKDTDIQKLMDQAKINEKKRIINEKELEKEAKLEKKRKLKEEKELLKQSKIEEKRRLKEEKELDKIIENDEKKKKKSSSKKSVSKIEIEDINNKKQTITSDANKGNLSKFEELVEKITLQDRPYPEVNDIPN
tara:strand:- start:10121 stop:10684 length:564 start_codon:yes stop_codon:yes gene_type:complete